MKRYTLHHGDCRAVMASMEPDSVDAIVTDPPYGLSFMGKEWDHGVPGVEFWREALRVLKPGGHILAAGGTRTFHRLTVAIEDAGFEIRDCISWMYGSGFPKSHNLHGEWHGWGTALKPAWEPFILARKPLSGTVADTVLTHGTGALNIDGCRIATTDNLNGGSYGNTSRDIDQYFAGKKPGGAGQFAQPSGRWPANVLLDEDSAEMLDAQSGLNVSRFFYVAKASASEREAGLEGMEVVQAGTMRGNTDYKPRLSGDGRQNPEIKPVYRSNHHPTVKPITLMRYLVRLITPPDGTVLDPFMGSGSTGCGAMLEGKRFIGIDITADYVAIAERRLAYWAEQNPMDV